MKTEVVSLHTYRALFACALATLALTTAAIGSEHPANGRLIADVPVDYGTADYSLPSNWTRGDLTFGSTYPHVTELLPPERYMLAGTEPSGPSQDDALPAWIDAVSHFCLDYYGQFANLPAQLTLAEIEALRSLQGESVTTADVALGLNPLTNEAPRLKADEFSPGDLYMRVLNLEEMHYYAQRRPALNDAWFNGRVRDPQTGRVGRAQLISSVLYVRAYGNTGVLYENLVYQLSEPDYSSAPLITARAKPVQDTDDDWSIVEDCAPSGG